MSHRITSVLSALNIARSTYYQWQNWQPSQQENRRVVSYGLRPEMTKEFVTSVVVKDLKANGKPMMIHSDMESQYNSSLFEGMLQSAGIKHSYSRKGHPYNNRRWCQYYGQVLRGVSSTRDDSSVPPSFWGNCYFSAPIIRLEKPPAGHAVTGQFIIAGSLSARACHAERYPRRASWCQLNHIKKKLR